MQVAIKETVLLMVTLLLIVTTIHHRDIRILHHFILIANPLANIDNTANAYVGPHGPIRISKH